MHLISGFSSELMVSRKLVEGFGGSHKIIPATHVETYIFEKQAAKLVL